MRQRDRAAVRLERAAGLDLVVGLFVAALAVKPVRHGRNGLVVVVNIPHGRAELFKLVVVLDCLSASISDEKLTLLARG